MDGITGTPVLISGMENSGTRVAVWYLQSIGIDVGEDLYDEMSWRPIDGFVEKYLFQYYREKNYDFLKKRLDSRLGEHLKQSRVWGFKSSRAIYMLDFFKKAIPSLKFIHIIRDGRDVSDKFIQFAMNDAELTGMFGGQIKKDNIENLHDAYLHIWGVINLAARKIFQDYPEDYLCIRLEDMVAPGKKKRTMSSIINFLGVEFFLEKGKKYEVFYRLTVPKSIGRHVDEGRIFSNSNLKFLRGFGYDI